MKHFFQRLPEQAVRVIVLFIVLAATLVVVRQFVLPRSLTDTTLQKAQATERVAAKEIKYAGAQTCVQCHEKEPELKKKGYHRDLACESCHGASAKHVEDPASVKPLSPKLRDNCTFCHIYNSSKPSGFPQINPETHNPRTPCISCHNPHDPTPPTAPSSCNACHAQIERTKIASYHALLECSVCHEAPEKHKTEPRLVRPTKPDKREFCGKCHAQGSKAGAPTIDMSSHGEKYVCWQCHYPHMLGGI